MYRKLITVQSSLLGQSSCIFFQEYFIFLARIGFSSRVIFYFAGQGVLLCNIREGEKNAQSVAQSLAQSVAQSVVLSVAQSVTF